MIGSLISRMADAEKLSVDQLQKAVQNGTLPAYVGIPLIQDKMNQQKEAQAMAQGGEQKQPPIAEQVMAEAAQHGIDEAQSNLYPQETGMPVPNPRGIDEAQSNLPTQEMAGGGIVAFAGGDLVEDDEEEDESTEERRLAAETQGLFNAAAGRIGEGTEAGLGFGGISPEKAREAGLGFGSVSPEKAKEIAYSINPEVKGGFGIKDILTTKAAENKLPPELLNRIAGVESSYKPTAANPNSTAKGLFQFTNSTWKSMGGKEGEQFDPEKNAELGAKFIRQNAEGLKSALGRDPTYGEVYASHFFGLKGAKDLLNMDPRTPMDQAVSAQVLKANPQLRNKTVGQVMAGLNNKMGEGIVALARGGEVKHFRAGGNGTMSGFDDTYTDTYVPPAPEIDEYTIDPATGEKSFSGYRGKSKAKPTPADKNTGPGFTYDQMVAGSSRAGTEEAMNKDLTSGLPEVSPKLDTQNVGIDSARTKQPSFEDKYLELLKGREASSTKQRSVDNYMALLQAGLGMMGGTSPFAAVNIGQGASTGIAAKMAAEKNRIAEENATMKGYGNLYNIQQNAEMRKTLAGQGQEASQRKAAGQSLLNLEQKTKQNYMTQFGKTMIGASAEEVAAAADKAAMADLARNDTYKNMFKIYNGYDYTAPAVTPTVIDYSKTYGLTPKSK
jgi:hypothetical protein